MFGCLHGTVVGKPVRSLIPADLRLLHAVQRAEWRGNPEPRKPGTIAHLVGVRQDGSNFPIRVSLSHVSAATSRFKPSER
jgi:hypothetical protein